MLIPVLTSLLLLIAPAVSSRTAALARLEGEWTVDLRPTSDAPAHPMPMTLKIAEDGVVSGMFYQGPIELGLASDNKGAQCFAFTTTDGTGPYHTSGCLDGSGRIEGQTWSEGRHFLMHWMAVRTAAEVKPIPPR